MSTEKIGYGLGIAGHYDERGEMVVTSVSFVDPKCMLCHVNAGGGYVIGVVDRDGNHREIPRPTRHTGCAVS